MLCFRCVVGWTSSVCHAGCVRIGDKMCQRSAVSRTFLSLFVAIATVFALLFYAYAPRNDVTFNRFVEADEWRHAARTRTEPARSQPEVASPILEALPPSLGRDIFRYRVMYAADDVRLYVYSSFVDDRVTPNVIRIIGVQHRDVDVIEFNCGFARTTNDSRPTVTWRSRVRWEYIDRSWPDWSPYFAIQVECPLTADLSPPPAHVILSYTTPDANNSLTLPVEAAIRVRNRKSLAVVVKPITGQFYVARLVEWIELQRLIGIDHLILYNSDLSGPSRYVLDYYQSSGVVHVVAFPYLTSVLEKVEERVGLTPEDRYALYQQLYLVALQGALYRFRNAFRYMAVIDLDEVILPTNRGARLLDVVDSLSRDHPDGAGFTFPTAWHFEDAKPVADPEVPPYLYMQIFARASQPSDIQPKSVLVTSRTRTLNFHVVVTALNRSHVTEVPVDWRRYGYVHHYRGRCEDKFLPDMCQSIVRNSSLDGIMTRYLSDLKYRVLNVLDHLQLR